MMTSYSRRLIVTVIACFRHAANANMKDSHTTQRNFSENLIALIQSTSLAAQVLTDIGLKQDSTQE